MIRGFSLGISAARLSSRRGIGDSGAVIAVNLRPLQKLGRGKNGPELRSCRVAVDFGSAKLLGFFFLLGFLDLVSSPLLLGLSSSGIVLCVLYWCVYDFPHLQLNSAFYLV